MNKWLKDVSHLLAFSARSDSGTYFFQNSGGGRIAYLWRDQSDAERMLKWRSLTVGNFVAFQIVHMKDWLAELESKGVELIIEYGRRQSEAFLDHEFIHWHRVKDEQSRFVDPCPE